MLYYETRFLRENKIAQRSNWINFHNNQTLKVNYGTPEFEKFMMSKYGVKNPMHYTTFKDKCKQTHIDRYGVTRIFELQEFIENQKKQNIQKYGSTTFIHSEQGAQLIKMNYNEKYGVDHWMKRLDIHEKSKNTMYKNHGVYFTLQSIQLREIVEKTLIERYGVDNPSKSPEVKLKKVETTNRNFGKDYNSKIACKCPYCNYITSLNQFSIHAKKCFLKHNDVWKEIQSNEEWSKYITQIEDLKILEIRKKTKEEIFGTGSKQFTICKCKHCQKEINLPNFHRHANSCWPTFGDIWHKPKSDYEWSQYIHKKSTKNIDTAISDQYVHPSKLRCICPYCSHTTSASALSKHANKCWPKYGAVWIKPSNKEGWNQYIYSEDESV